MRPFRGALPAAEDGPGHRGNLLRQPGRLAQQGLQVQVHVFHQRALSLVAGIELAQGVEFILGREQSSPFDTHRP